MDNVYEFLEDYVAIFLELFNYHYDEEQIEAIEQKLSSINRVIEQKRETNNIIHYNELVQKYSKELDNDLFNYIKKQVADENPAFFNKKINELNNLLNNNMSYAGQCRMKINTDSQKLTFADYYNNYLIALTELIGSEETSEETNASVETL